MCARPARLRSYGVLQVLEVIPVNVFIILNQIIKMMSVKMANGHRLNEVRTVGRGTAG
jgi:hypothetical protein